MDINIFIIDLSTWQSSFYGLSVMRGKRFEVTVLLVLLKATAVD